MNAARIAQQLGWLLVALAVAQLIPGAAAVVWGEPALPFLASAVAAAVFGLPLALGTKPADKRIRTRDALAIATAGWIFAAAFGALPYVMTGALHPIDALFESMSGFTTTASSVLASVESIPRSLTLWRSMTQWLGGMGVVAAAVALLPVLGIGGMQQFATRDSTGSVKHSLVVSLTRLLAVYLGLTGLAFAALFLAGLGVFDAACHAMTGVSTGGFSTRDGSVASFGSAAVEWVLIVTMVLGATSFLSLYRLATGAGRQLLVDAELRSYIAVLVVAAALVGWSISADSGGGDATAAVFQTASMLSGTGYRSADFSTWAPLAQFLLLSLMVIGGMTNSTAGGLKSLRVLLCVRALRDSFTSLLHPHAVRRVKFAGRAVPGEALGAVWAFVAAYFAVVGVAAAIVATAGGDLVTAVSVAFSVTSNVGPALGEVGPSGYLGNLPAAAKLGLSLCMLAGRLDVLTVLVVFRPRFWRA